MDIVYEVGETIMERLTHERKSGMKTGYWSPNKKQELVDRLAMYEDREDAKDTNVLGKWIPCSERLPEHYVTVLAQHGKRFSDEQFIRPLVLTDEEEWYGDSGLLDGEVVAWMPLPEPMKEDGV